MQVRMLSAMVSLPVFFFHGPIRSDDPPPVPHIVSIFSIQRDPVFPSWFALCLQTSILWCYCCMTSLVFHVFASHLLSPGSHTSPARTRRLWWCVQRRRVCDVQQILEAVWWCQAPWGCCRLFYVQSNWLVTSDDKSTVLLIGSFSHQLLWESSLLRHRWELSTPASVLVSFSVYLRVGPTDNNIWLVISLLLWIIISFWIATVSSSASIFKISCLPPHNFQVM